MHVNISDVHMCVGPIKHLVLCTTTLCSISWGHSFSQVETQGFQFAYLCPQNAQIPRGQQACPALCGFWGSKHMHMLTQQVLYTVSNLPSSEFCFFEIASHSVSWLAWNSLRWELTVALPLSAGIIGVCPESPHLAQVILGYTVSQSLWVALWKCNLWKAFIHLKQTQTEHTFVYSSNENDQLFLINIATYLTVV